MASDGFQHKSAFSFFVSRVRQNLHVILSMDPSNPDYDMRCASNPALFAACSVLWMETWSPERMQVCPDSCFGGTLFLKLIAFEIEGDHAIYALFAHFLLLNTGNTDMNCITYALFGAVNGTWCSGETQAI